MLTSAWCVLSWWFASWVLAVCALTSATERHVRWTSAMFLFATTVVCVGLFVAVLVGINS